MQLVIKHSKEGELPGLSWVDTETIRIRFNPKESIFNILHIGLNTERPNERARFYFVQSFQVVTLNPEGASACAVVSIIGDFWRNRAALLSFPESKLLEIILGDK